MKRVAAVLDDPPSAKFFAGRRNLFLRKQLALFRERDVKPRRADDATRAAQSKVFNWRDALVIVKPATLVGWYRKGFRLFWKLKSRAGRPALPGELN